MPGCAGRAVELSLEEVVDLRHVALCAASRVELYVNFAAARRGNRRCARPAD